jgi:hypothetical protein
MRRLLFATTFAALGVALVATQTQAAVPISHRSGHPSGGSGHVMNGHHDTFRHSFRANSRFDYGRFGYRSLHWTRYGWSHRYNNYCYWAPNFGWCFYEPTYACYLPISYYPQVYPEASFSTAAAPAPVPVVTSSPAVVQQTSVVVGGPAIPTADVPAPPLVAPPVAPPATAVQQTKVGPGLP